ncbi:golgi transport complex subunit Cog6 [Histoplasma capsulatum var. duboisii H88]|uniref:Conserved oligomeric Golgi complex subunit 6 n=1 Tax=Ajellomyces capsulatus (strain H88) TaxID=544711 RepID=F0U7T7_AJEC8|nr:golgi transport complex subunit Cog6 [Histoplasma capsulatum var. duboisii H88]QSS51141.1 golgi transport complex subunit Cog6 [Histoplasma capsulatum var. duboisii H88]
MSNYFSNSPGSASSGTNGAGQSLLSLPGAAVPRSTALSNKLNSVLSASYADSDIRGALEILDDRGIQNTPETRRQLKLDVQREVIDSNGKIVQDFGKVAQQLKRVGTAISNLTNVCEEMRRHIVLATQETAPLFEEAAILMSQQQEVETKEKILDAFNNHFILSEDELASLTSSAKPVDDLFFDALARMKQIHKDCEVLLGSENQRLGLDIMEQSSKNLNGAFQKLYKWIQKEFKSLNLEDPQISSSIRRALRVLAERPSLFHNCLDSFADAREYTLSDSFHTALTDVPSGQERDMAARPIEFSAHDPLRYVGDMLAWVHSAAVSEREALEALFIGDEGEIAKGIQAGVNSEPWSRVDGEEIVFDGPKALNDLVTRDLNGVARSLRQRVELVLQGNEDPIVIYKIIGLLAFYENTFSKLLERESGLVTSVASLQEFAFKHFQILMQDQLAVVSAEPANLTPPADLGTPQFLHDALDNLTSLMKAYDSSFAHEHANDSSGENKFSPIIREALDPFLELARTSSNDISDPTSRAVFHVNCLLSTRDVISPYPFVCVTHLPQLTNTLKTLRTTLLEIQHEFLLNASGLHMLLTALKPFTPPATATLEPTPSSYPPDLATISSLPEFQPQTISSISQQLDDFLPSALVDATENLKAIRSPVLVKSVTEEAVEAFCIDFEFVEGMILGADEARGKSVVHGDGEDAGVEEAGAGEGEGEELQGDNWRLRSLFPRTTGEIRVLLS